VAYPNIDWVKFANHFVNTILELHRSQTTTQIEHYDNIAAMFDNLKRINTILLDFSRDMWTYISMDYFKQRIKEGEIGSSAMPHKVNPIDFENAEGNIGLANAMFEHLSAKLPVSRLQRDLTDSTVFRNMGVPIAHTMIALNSLRKGFAKLQLNESALKHDLSQNWAVVAEAIQTILRRENYPNQSAPERGQTYNMPHRHRRRCNPPDSLRRYKPQGRHEGSGSPPRRDGAVARDRRPGRDQGYQGARLGQLRDDLRFVGDRIVRLVPVY
jgi:adenylosuccinate lyase